MKKTAIIYGELKTDIQKRALEELTALLFDYTLEYPICAPHREDVDADALRCIYIGTVDSNPYIRETSLGELCTPESYSIRVKDDTVTVEGYDDAGVLYGVLDLYSKYTIKFEHSVIRGTNEDWDNIWAGECLPEFECISAPAVRERGLWTWGHVIYDYRAYLHNMMKLKMNCVIIWNDFVPTNARDIVAYAHSCNIKVYWGFEWLWDNVLTPGFDINDLEGESERIFCKYEAEYADSNGDGIYFQTFTERKTDNIGGVLIAEAATNFVNRTASLFYGKYPDIELQFGLHATSVKNRLEFIRSVDPRIRIVWEDCGAFPFAYLPQNVKDFEGTKEFVGKIANLRGDGDRFGVVTKGMLTLDWSRFEHQRGSQCIGVASERAKRHAADRRARQWRYIQTGWMTNADKASEMIGQMRRLKRGDLSVFALVEDGAFEENIMFPVALCAEMLWSGDADTAELIRDVSLREYVRFV